MPHFFTRYVPQCVKQCLGVDEQVPLLDDEAQRSEEIQRISESIQQLVRSKDYHPEEEEADDPDEQPAGPEL